MKVCPACQRSHKTSERIEQDKEDSKKHWLITFCAKCGFNYDLEEYTGKVLSPQDEMKKYDWPENKKRLPPPPN